MRELKAGTCPRCGNSLEGDAVEGLCAQCLLDPSWNADVDASGGGAGASSSDPLQIGPYKLLELIGEGGFGSVYAAQQEHPVSRRVALKIIKLGMDTRQVVARFDAERQALELMDHPNIARVLDAGATDTGRPFFVMEWVQGVPVTRYCDDNRLPTRQRLELFVQVCRAVQHAHQKGVIHRDIKPSNVMVTTTDGRPVPKVIDFGIAKAIQGPLAERTALTEARQFLGTPEYMSPEQAGGGERSGDVDTRSDVYSLGVLLYELLTGTTPFTAEELRDKPHEQVQRMLREVDPPRPSTRVESLAGAAGAAVADRRATQAKRLGRALRGDLDWVVMKCLEKDRARRYETAAALADDVDRHLRGEPVTAGPPSRAYRVRKLVLRNKGPLAAGGVVIVALLVGLGAATVGFLRARADRDRAVSAQVQESRQRRIAEAVTQFLTRTLESANPNVAFDRGLDGNALTVRQALDEAAKLIDRGELASEPEVEATVRVTLGSTYLGLGLFESGDPQFRKSLAIRRQLFGSRHLNVAESLTGVGACVRHSDAAAAEPLLREAMSIESQVSGDRRDALAQTTLTHLAQTLQDMGDFTGAEQLLREFIAARRKAGAANDAALAATMSSLASIYMMEGDYANALTNLRDALAIQQVTLPKNHPDLAATQARLGDAVANTGDAVGALPFLRDAYETAEKLYPPDDPRRLTALANLAQTLADTGDTTKAEAMARDALAVAEKSPAGHPADLFALRSVLASVLIKKRDFAEAGKVYDESLEKLHQVGRAEDSMSAAQKIQLIGMLHNLGGIYHERGERDKAVEIFQDALSRHKKWFPKDSRGIAEQLYMIALSLHTKGDRGAAEQYYVDALALQRQALSPDDPALAVTACNLSGLLHDKGDLKGAEELGREAVAIQRKVPAVHPYLVVFLDNLARVLRDAKKLTEARSVLVEALAAQSRLLDAAPANAGPVHLASLVAKRGEYHARLGRFAEASADYMKAVDSDPSDHMYWYRCAVLELYLDDRDAYRRHRDGMLRQFDQTDRREVAERTAKMALLVPRGGDDLAAPERLIARARAPGAPEDFQPWAELAQGMLEYRLGRFKEAADTLTHAFERNRYGSGKIAALLFLAMADERLGESAEATEFLDTARTTIEQKLPRHDVDDIGHFGIEEWLICHIILREAETLVRKSGAATNPATAPATKQYAPAPGP